MLPLPLPILALVASAYAQFGNVSDYAPSVNVQCPTEPLVRLVSPQNQTLNAQEVAYLNSRSASVLPSQWQAWIGDGSAIGYNLSAFSGKLPKISISVSGGGYRAAQYGAGVLEAIDARNESAKTAGTGGLLQVSSYWAGLSGGSWLTGSLYMNNWPNVSDLVFGNGKELGGWLLNLEMPTPNGYNIFDDKNQNFYRDIIDSISAKANTTISTSITDPWARMISYHFLNGTNTDNFYSGDVEHGAGQFWSRIPATSSFAQLFPPFPIVVADSRPDGQNTTYTPLNSTVYEITPYEFGSWDPSLGAMLNLTYAGTHLVNGQPANSTACVTGFDQAGFVMGTSASLFNSYLDSFSGADERALAYLLGRNITEDDDVANWPNPFQGLSSGTFQDSQHDYLPLIDGGLNLENVPLGPMFLKARGLDFIVAVDSSFDTDNTWPNATALLTTSQRLSTILNSTHQPFPPIPANAEAFVSTGTNRRPTFFGCDPTQSPPEWPLVLYLPNAPPLDGSAPAANTNTFKLQYSQKHTVIILEQVFNNTVGGFVPNTTGADPNWPKCLQCGAIDRSRYKTSPVTQRSSFCQTCFTQYCYDPRNPPSQSELPGRNFVYEDPDPKGLTKAESDFQRHEGAILGGAIGGAVALIAAIIAFLLWRRHRKAKKYAAVHQRSESDVLPLQGISHQPDPSYSYPNMPEARQVQY
ncbi:phospholipase B [Auriscalpium vulgare]|uniref:Phospholipase B n=1 Tax=Auriscalpium vulgare TaxID=40419 RepID=A0ACB8RJY8_9AGAM|nr:phospholipase B [Auriscalpium vulgare]